MADMTIEMRPTDAEVADQTIRRHLAALVFATQEGGDAEVARLARMEICRLVSAICTALRIHRLDAAGRCTACANDFCVLLAEIRRALLPVRLSTQER
jgi:hypothetical protein